MIKFRQIGAYKTAQNIGYLTTPVALKNGMGVVFDLVNKTVALPDATTAKGNVALVFNTIDKPEIKTPNDYTIEIGENPRIFPLKSLAGRIIDMDSSQITTAYASLAVNDKLTLGTDGKWVKTADVTGYATYLQIVEKTTFGGAGIGAVVVA